MIISNRKINDVCIIDDDIDSRNAMQLTIEDSSLNPVPQDNKVLNFDNYLSSINGAYDAIVTDHHLRKKNYFPINGAEIVYKCFELQMPSILVTRYEQAVVDEIRMYRSRIPIVLSPEDFNPDSLLSSLETCINEFDGIFIPERKLWRTMVRIDDIDDSHIYLLIPAWNANQMISISRNIIPSNVEKDLQADMRLFVMVNIGATNSRDLYFQNWELK